MDNSVPSTTFADYVDTIEDMVLAFRSSGFMLSAKDEAVIAEWWEANISLRAVLQGIEAGIADHRRRYGENRGKPTGLGFFRKFVTESNTHMVITGTEPLEDASGNVSEDQDPRVPLCLALEACTVKQTTEELTVILKNMIRLIQNLDEAGLWDALPGLEADLMDTLWNLLSEHVQNELRTQAESTVDPGHELGERARREQTQIETRRMLRARFGVPGLVELALSVSQV
jgi:hypothetical protein